MQIEKRIQALIAVGASLAANCQPCLQNTIAKALESGANEQEIAEAIEVGKRVRKGAASKMDQFASSLNLTVLAASSASSGGCGCDSAAVTGMEVKK